MICCLKSLRIVGQLVNLSKSQGLKIKYNNQYTLYTAVCVCVCVGPSLIEKASRFDKLESARLYSCTTDMWNGCGRSCFLRRFKRAE
jgi:hypothetical protein